MSDKMNTTYDLAIVGGGPAGSSTAFHAARTGLKTILFEKQSYPRKKLCGGALSQRNKPLLGENAITAINSHIREIRIVGPSFKRFTFDKGSGYFVIRRDFDHAMAKDAAAAGAEIKDNCPVESIITLRSGDYELKTAQGIFKAKYVVLSTGVANKLIKQLEIPRNREKDYMAITVMSETSIDNKVLEKTGFEGAVLAIFFGAVPNGYGWCFVKDGYINIGIGATAMLMKGIGAIDAYRNFVKNLKEKGLLPHDLELAKERGFPLPFKKTADRVIKGKVLLVGDSAGFVSPVSGEGLYFGIKGGQLAAEAIKNNLEKDVPLTSYRESWEKDFGRDLNKYGYFLQKTLYKSKKRMEFVVTLGRGDKKMALIFYKMLLGIYSYKKTIFSALLRLPASLLKLIFSGSK